MRPDIAARDIANLVGVDAAMIRRRRRRGETDEDILMYYGRNHGWTSMLVQSSLAKALVALGRWYNNYNMAFPLVGEVLAPTFVVDSYIDQWYNENSRTNVGAELGRNGG